MLTLLKENPNPESQDSKPMPMDADSSSSDTTSSSGLQQNSSSQIPDSVRVGTEELEVSPAVSNPEGKDGQSEAGEDAKSQIFCSGGAGIVDRVGEGKKDAAWKKSSNVSEASVDVAGSVMGDNSWPDLSMAAEVKVSRRSSADHLKNLSGVTAPISSTLPLNSELVIQKNVPRGSSNHNSSSNSAGFPRQKSLKSGGRTGPAEMSNLTERPPLVAEQRLSPPPPPPGVFLKVNSRRLANGPRPAPTYGNYGLKDQTYQPHFSKNYGSNPRRSFGYHNGNGAGHYQEDHRRYGLTPSQPFYVPDAQMLHPYQQWPVFRPHLQSPPLPPPALIGPQYFFSSRPPPVQPFVNPHEVHPQIYGMPEPPQPPLEAYRYLSIPGQYAPYSTKSDAVLRKDIATQAEFYFSEQNLHKDSYLKNLMDPFGWVPISIIAGFNRMKLLTGDIQLISECLQSSPTVEVQGDKMRRRNDWMRWLPPPAPLLENHRVPSPVLPEPRGDQSPSTTDHANGACAEPAANQSTICNSQLSDVIYNGVVEGTQALSFDETSTGNTLPDSVSA